jgi:hypothetical protein
MATTKKPATEKEPDLKSLGASIDRALKRHGVDAGGVTIHPPLAEAADGTCLKPFIENGHIVFRRVPC